MSQPPLAGTSTPVALDSRDTEGVMKPAASASVAALVKSPAITSRHVLLVFGIALLLRVLVVLWLNLAPPAYRPTMPLFAPDSMGYDGLARSILAGQGYQMGGDFREYTRIPPLFSFFLAGLYALWGPSIIGTGLANAVLGALTAVLLFYVVRDGLTYAIAGTDTQEKPKREGFTAQFAAQVAFVTALIFAVYPLEIFNTPYVLKENFSIFLTAGFVFVWVRLLRALITSESSRVSAWALLCGVVLGLSVLSRYTHLGLAVVFASVNGWLIWRHRKLASFPTRLSLNTGLALLAFGLTLAPWLIRNYNLFGQVVLSSHGPARYLYTSNSHLAEPETSGYFEGRGQTDEYQTAVDAKTGHNVKQQEQIYARNALESITSRPLHVARLMGAKFVCMWRPVWEGSSLKTWLILGVPYILMLILALHGMFLYYKYARSQPAFSYPVVAVLSGVILYYFLGHLVFYGMIRERQYVEPYLMVFAAYSFCCLRLKKE